MRFDSDRHQMQHGSHCSFCKNAVQPVAMGKYAVRFGLEARQFCSGACLEEYKKGLKSCSYCQVDISKNTNTYVATINDKQSMMQKVSRREVHKLLDLWKDYIIGLISQGFCSLSCAEKYERMCSNNPVPAILDTCTVCTHKKPIEIQVLVNNQTNFLCSDVCFRAFKFANGINDTGKHLSHLLTNNSFGGVVATWMVFCFPDRCQICQVYFQENSPNSHFIFHEDVPYHFCSKVCLNVFILFRRKIVPCSWCKVRSQNWITFM